MIRITVTVFAAETQLYRHKETERKRRGDREISSFLLNLMQKILLTNAIIRLSSTLDNR